MKAVVLTSLFLVFLSVEGQLCQSPGLGGCECNILGACDNKRNKVKGLDNKMTGYTPSGIEQFGYVKHGTKKLAYLCDDDTVAILYDCNARIPLYAATVMTGSQITAAYQRPNKDFRVSKKLDRAFQQNNNDYKHSNRRNLCYESSAAPGGARYFVEREWYKAAKEGKDTVPPNQQCDAAHAINTPVHKGHLIAARYGAGNTTRIRATFTYTNAVPQFGTFNSGAWMAAEGEVITWAEKNCAEHGGQQTENARIFIVVGAIPSTHRWPKQQSNPRFFGESGFSDYQDRSQLPKTYGANTGGKEYRVNVPRYMWTAVCCTFQYQTKGKRKNEVKSMAFYRENQPRTGRVVTGTVFPAGVEIFPQNAACNF